MLCSVFQVLFSFCSLVPCSPFFPKTPGRPSNISSVIWFGLFGGYSRCCLNFTSPITTMLNKRPMKNFTMKLGQCLFTLHNCSVELLRSAMLDSMKTTTTTTTTTRKKRTTYKCNGKAKNC